MKADELFDRLSGADFAKVPMPRLLLGTVVPREVREYMGLPVFPPVLLGPGGTVEIWWVIADGVVAYHHAGSTRDGARRMLLRALHDRALRLIAQDALSGLCSSHPC